LSPSSSGKEVLWEKIDGTFVRGDLCSFQITNPSQSDLNDVMSIRIEFLDRTNAWLLKGESIDEPSIMYEIKAGQTYTAPRYVNFYLLFEATTTLSGKYVFTTWWDSADGYGTN